MKINTNRGFIKTIIILVIAIIILSYYGIDLQKVITSEPVQKNLSYVWSLVVAGWNLFVTYVWLPVKNILSNHGVVVQVNQ